MREYQLMIKLTKAIACQVRSNCVASTQSDLALSSLLNS